jgi:hypothetical protein
MIAERLNAEREVEADEDVSLPELQAIEDEEEEDLIFEEIAQAEKDVVIEEAEAIVAEEEVDDIQKELDED